MSKVNSFYEKVIGSKINLTPMELKDLWREDIAAMTEQEFNLHRERLFQFSIPIFEKMNQRLGDKHIGIHQFYEGLPDMTQTVGADDMPALQELYAQFCFWRAGCKIYDIHPNLANRFKITSLRAVPIELLRLPFDTIKLLIPAGLLKCNLSNAPEKEMFAREITTTIADSTLIKGKKEMMIFYQFKSDIGYFRIQLSQPEVLRCVEHTFDILLAGDRPSWVEGKPVELTAQDRQALKAMFEFTLKSILYITGADADVEWWDERSALEGQLRRAKSGGKAKEIARRLERAKALYKVGHRIVLSREEKMMHENINKGLWHVGHRFIVQGHWRHQAHGPHHSERKLIFIEPHYKGPAFTELINNPHLVK